MHTIGNEAFIRCSKLRSITIPKSVTSIGYGIFYGCSGLVAIDIPNGVTKMGGSAFFGCRKITSIILPASLETIEMYAFFGCYSLESVTIPSNLSKIGIMAFHGCPLKWVTSLIINPYSIGNDVFQTKDENAVLYVPKGTKSKYESTSGWNTFKNIEEIINKCKTPTVYYNNGQLNFECETEDVIYKTSITNRDIKNYSTSEINLSATYNINVYATKSGYDDSDVATATLCWIDADPKTEGITNSVANVRANAVLIQGNGGNLSIQGIDEGTPINVYNTSGQVVGSVRASTGTTNVNTTLRVGDVGIVKIGDKSVKVLIK